jgi:hypothetical protein
MVFGEQSKTANQRSLQHTTIPDTVDGAEFKKRKENGGFLTNKNNVALSLFSDFIPLFQSFFVVCASHY